MSKDDVRFITETALKTFGADLDGDNGCVVALKQWLEDVGYDASFLDEVRASITGSEP